MPKKKRLLQFALGLLFIALIVGVASSIPAQEDRPLAGEPCALSTMINLAGLPKTSQNFPF